MFSVVCDKDIKPESIKKGEKIYLNVQHFLDFERFLPKKKGEKAPAKKGGKPGRGRGGARGGGGRGGRGGRGNQGGGFRQSRGGNSSGGFRPPRSQSDGYKPPRKDK